MENPYDAEERLRRRWRKLAVRVALAAEEAAEEAAEAAVDLMTNTPDGGVAEAAKNTQVGAARMKAAKAAAATNDINCPICRELLEFAMLSAIDCTSDYPADCPGCPGPPAVVELSVAWRKLMRFHQRLARWLYKRHCFLLFCSFLQCNKWQGQLLFLVLPWLVMVLELSPENMLRLFLLKLEQLALRLLGRNPHLRLVYEFVIIS